MLKQNTNTKNIITHKQIFTDYKNNNNLHLDTNTELEKLNLLIYIQKIHFDNYLIICIMYFSIKNLSTNVTF